MAKRIMSFVLVLGLSLGVVSASVATTDVITKDLAKIVLLAKKAGMSEKEIKKEIEKVAAEVAVFAFPGSVALTDVNGLTIFIVVGVGGIFLGWRWYRNVRNRLLFGRYHII